MYDLGARRVIVTGTGPLGCAPAEIAMRSTNGRCARELMRAADLFNPRVEKALKELNSQFGSDVFISANSNRMHFDFVMNPRAYGDKIINHIINFPILLAFFALIVRLILDNIYNKLILLWNKSLLNQTWYVKFFLFPFLIGFKTGKVACCGQGRYNGIGICNMLSNLCKNRNEYVFWDAYHPTERANRLIVNQMMTGTVDYMSPMNLSTILALDEMHWWICRFN